MKAIDAIQVGEIARLLGSGANPRQTDILYEQAPCFTAIRVCQRTTLRRRAHRFQASPLDLDNPCCARSCQLVLHPRMLGAKRHSGLERGMEHNRPFPGGDLRGSGTGSEADLRKVSHRSQTLAGTWPLN
ncbi:hypothetical protein CHELA40_13635 [Chelatococcus asaccharovorans]|nr:hypothetical protein CHELA40_13635 [Chelatococcus asaccharovorans]CAH1676668.1 hypothetical protein CHELA17_61988 [Chelatococcus asaccharovorans]